MGMGRSSVAMIVRCGVCWRRLVTAIAELGAHFFPGQLGFRQQQDRVGIEIQIQPAGRLQQILRLRRQKRKLRRAREFTQGCAR
jgi:hypothetical protein